MAVELQQVSDSGDRQGAIPEPDVYFWVSPDAEPLAANISAEQALSLAVKATQARFRRKAVSEKEVVSRPKSHSKPDIKTAHTYLLGLLNNSSIDYPTIAEQLPGYKQDESLAMTAMNKATRRINRKSSLQGKFGEIQDGFLERLVAQEALKRTVQ